ncbi:FtsX-like permease family protein [candidate division KSB1 bacterium]|nr:FtsX-like permease family protein [candidate division KSB1 bacterium]
MIIFLLKGLIRDRQRSLFPILVVTIGVMLTVLLHCWFTGVIGDMIDASARFSTGHVKVVTRAYAENMDQVPIDLALVQVNDLLKTLRNDFPTIQWVERIHFGGLIDLPDENGETKAQGPAVGMAIDLLSGQSSEIERLNIGKSLKRGQMPKKSGEILISDEFASKLGLNPGSTATLISSSMFGSMTMQNFVIAGTIQFGIQVMDRGAIIVDITDARMALDMIDASSEVLGYLPGGMYNDEAADVVANQFNAAYEGSTDEFAPVMLKLKDQNDLAGMLDYMSSMIAIFIAVFIFAMSLVLWNVGLIGGLRRYGEVGIRLAIGEFKSHVYRSMIWESILVGICGSSAGTLIGLGLAYLLQTKGLDIGYAMKNATIMLPNVIRAHITPPAYFIGFIPGLFSTVLGTMLSGIGIYRRKTAQLFKELEV